MKLPKLTGSQGNYTKDALVLVYLAQGYQNTKKVSKGELTQFIRLYDPSVNDVQQARDTLPLKRGGLLPQAVAITEMSFWHGASTNSSP
ncbi:MAG: hypothetical protein OCU12_06890 [Methanophagales archaeon]|nr:hypothetical protein [Methanophagales archaeon]